MVPACQNYFHCCRVYKFGTPLRWNTENDAGCRMPRAKGEAIGVRRQSIVIPRTGPYDIASASSTCTNAHLASCALEAMAEQGRRQIELVAGRSTRAKGCVCCCCCCCCCGSCRCCCLCACVCLGRFLLAWSVSGSLSWASRGSGPPDPSHCTDHQGKHYLRRIN